MDFHVLYERYAPHVRRFALFLCGDQALADDISSETFVRAWVAQGKIVQDTVKAYLFAIARNLYRDSLRDARRYAPLADAAQAAGLETHQEIKSELRAVLDAMQSLPEADRAALLMRAHSVCADRLLTSSGDNRAGAYLRAWTCIRRPERCDRNHGLRPVIRRAGVLAQESASRDHRSRMVRFRYRLPHARLVTAKPSECGSSM